MKPRFLRLLAAGALGVLLFSLPTLAFAAEEAEESAAGIGLFIPKLGEFIPMLVGFLILWAILAKFGWPAFLGMIDKRAAAIKESLERAEDAKVQGEQLLEERQAELDAAKKQAAEIIAQAKQTAESVKAGITAQAQSEAETIIAKARQEIAIEKKAAMAELQGETASFTVAVAKKVIGTDLSSAEHLRIIERYVAEAGSFNEN